MIKIQDAQITDALSAVYAGAPETKAVSYAIKQVCTLFFDFCKNIKFWCDIDSASDEVLNALAIEMRVITYDTSLSREKRTALIKEAFNQWAKAGTKSALEEIAANVFSNAAVEEWFNYEGEPGHFKVKTTNMSVTGDKLLKLQELVKDYKRLSTTLDGVEITNTTGSAAICSGLAFAVVEIERFPKITI